MKKIKIQFEKIARLDNWLTPYKWIVIMVWWFAMFVEFIKNNENGYIALSVLILPAIYDWIPDKNGCNARVKKAIKSGIEKIRKPILNILFLITVMHILYIKLPKWRKN